MCVCVCVRVCKCGCVGRTFEAECLARAQEGRGVGSAEPQLLQPSLWNITWVCACVCARVCVYVCVCVGSAEPQLLQPSLGNITWVCVCVCVCARARARVFKRDLVATSCDSAACMYACVCLHVNVCTWVCVCARTCVCVCGRATRPCCHAVQLGGRRRFAGHPARPIQSG